MSEPTTPDPESPSASAARRPSLLLSRRPSFCQMDMEKYRKAFDMCANKTRPDRLEIAHLGRAAALVGYKLTEQQSQDIMKHNNYDNGTMLTFDQFLDAVPRNSIEVTAEQHRLAEFREKFQRYDLDSNGYISLSEAQWALQVELDVTHTTALRLLNQFVKLDYEHFVEFYGKVQDKKLEIYDMFGKYDQDLDGLISIDEAHTILHKELGFTEERSRAMVNRYDVNKDGRVSYVEFAEFYIAVEERKTRIRNAFQEFDQDKVGSVSVSQAQQILSGYLGFSENKAEKTVEIYDRNGDGRIDYEEFLEFFSMIEEERQRLLTEFHRYDKDGDGKISCEDFKEMLKSQGYSETELQTIAAGYDTDHDGFLSFDEFRRFLNFS